MKNNLSIKTSLSIFIIIVFISASSISAQPQDKLPKIPDATEIANMVNDLSEELSLSEKQHQKIKDLFTAHFSDLKEKMDDERKRDDAERKKIKNHREKFDQEVKNVLTEDQASQFDDYMKQRKGKRKCPKEKKK